MPRRPAKLGEIGKTFFDLLMGFEQAQVEYDIGCEDVMAAARRRVAQARRSSHSRRTSPFAVGKRAYHDGRAAAD